MRLKINFFIMLVIIIFLLTFLLFQGCGKVPDTNNSIASMNMDIKLSPSLALNTGNTYTLVVKVIYNEKYVTQVSKSFVFGSSNSFTYDYEYDNEGYYTIIAEVYYETELLGSNQETVRLTIGEIKTAELEITLPDHQGPVITHTPITSMSADSVDTLYIYVTDNSDSFSVYTYARGGGQTVWETAQITVYTDSLYIQNIYSRDTYVTIEYYIEASDGVNTTYFGYDGTSDSVPNQIIVYVNYTPSFYHTQVITSEKDTDITISAYVNDYNGIDNVYLMFKNYGEVEYNSLIMSNITGNTYSIQIDSTYVTRNIEYYIKAIDTLENIAYYGEKGDTTVEPDPITISVDSTPPDYITDIIAEAGVESATVSWTLTTAPDSYLYKIYYDTQSISDVTASSVTLAGTITSASGDTYYIVSGLTGGITYYFTVTCVDNSGNEDVYPQLNAETTPTQTTIIQGTISLPLSASQFAPSFHTTSETPFVSAEVIINLYDSILAQTYTNALGYYSASIYLTTDTANLIVTAFKNFSSGTIVVKNFVTNVKKDTTNTANVDTQTTALYLTSAGLKMMNQDVLPLETIYDYINTNIDSQNIQTNIVNIQNELLNSYQNGEDITSDTFKQTLQHELKDIGQDYYQFLISMIGLDSDSYAYFGVHDSAVIDDTSAGDTVLYNEIQKLLSSSQYSNYLVGASSTITKESIIAMIKSIADNYQLSGTIDSYTVAVAGDVSGTLTLTLYNINLDNLIFDSMTAAFDNFSGSVVVYNGTYTLILSDIISVNLADLVEIVGFSISSYPQIVQIFLSSKTLNIPLKFYVKTDSFSITIGDSCIQSKGDLIFGTEQTFSTFYAISNYVGDVNNSYMIEYDSLYVNITDTNVFFTQGGNILLSLGGTIKHSELGSVELETYDTVLFLEGDTLPTSGTLIFTFGNGKIKLTIVSTSTIQIKYAAVDDNYIITLYEGSWSDAVGILTSKME